MAKTNNINPSDKKLDHIIYLLEHLLALELNKTNLNRNVIRAHLGIDKGKVNKMLDGIRRDGLDKAKARRIPKKAKVRSKKKK